MKRLMYIIGCLLVAATSCNDDDAPVEPVEATTPLLTQVLRNGITNYEMFYDVDKKLYRLDYYFGATFSNYTLYEYSDAGLKELRRYAADDHMLLYRSVFTLDNFGRIIKGDNYGGPEFTEISSINQYTYNASGQLIKKDFRLTGNAVYSRQEYTYDDQNNLVKIENTLYPTEPSTYLSYQIDYVPGDKPIPSAWEPYVRILSLSELDERVIEMFYEQTHSRLWNSDQVIVNDYSRESSDRTVDSEGNLIRQVVTTKNLLKPENADVASEMTYEYVK